MVSFMMSAFALAAGSAIPPEAAATISASGTHVFESLTYGFYVMKSSQNP